MRRNVLALGTGIWLCASLLAAAAPEPGVQPVPAAAEDSATARAAAEPPAPGVDYFSFAGASNIQEEAHAGLFNGRLTPGIRFRQLGEIDGLWAPPYVSSDFRLRFLVNGRPVAAEEYTWWPFKLEQAGRRDGLRLRARIVLAARRRGGLAAFSIHNSNAAPAEVSLTCPVSGTLDYCARWEFGAPVSRTPAVAIEDKGAVRLRQGDAAVAVATLPVMESAGGSLTARWKLEPGQSATQYIAFAIGPAMDATMDGQALIAAPEQSLREAHQEHERQVRTLLERLPRLETSHRGLAGWYRRSLAHFLLNRWEVPEFLLRPFYGTGSIRGGCVCSYLWNFGEAWEILPLYDPDADCAHLRQYFRANMDDHFALEPLTGSAFGPWYPVGPEKLIGLVYYYVRNTGDTSFLADGVNGRTMLDHVLAQALCRDDITQPVALIDYGPSNSHLELRRGYAYNHTMPDLNGRRYANYLMAARLAELAGRPVPELRQRAAALKELLRRELWDSEARWFRFHTPRGPDLRWSNQMFKLFGGGVLDEVTEPGLLSHLNEREFLSDYGLHSLAKADVAYDPADIDNGGPGSCTSFPPQIAERLYKSGRAEAADDLLRRLLWWGERLPYWGDSLVADRIDYRKDTPLQCAFDSVAAAQCVIFGLLGIEAQFDGSVVIRPHAPAFAPELTLRDMRLRGLRFDVQVWRDRFEVRTAEGTARAQLGQAVRVQRGVPSVLPQPPSRSY